MLSLVLILSYSVRSHFGVVLRDRLLQRLILAICLMAIGASTVCCDGRELRPELVLGTARIEPGNIHTPWFTISPDEQWIAFMEIDSADWEKAQVHRRPGGYHLVTMSLLTFGKTHHRLDLLPTGTLTTEIPAWMEVRLFFEARSWTDGRLYIRTDGGIPGSRPWIAFTPGLVMAERVEPPGELSCCACPPPRDYVRALKNRGLGGFFGYGAGTAAYHDGRFSKTIYASPIGDENGGIDRVSEDGSVERIFEESRAFRRVEVDALLISPDERFLAFRLTTEVRSPVPLPTIRDELHALNLATGEHRRVGGTYRLIGDMMWSSDSKRLYYAAVNGAVADGREDGVFRIDFSQ